MWVRLYNRLSRWALAGCFCLCRHTTKARYTLIFIRIHSPAHENSVLPQNKHTRGKNHKTCTNPYTHGILQRYITNINIHPFMRTIAVEPRGHFISTKPSAARIFARWSAHFAAILRRVRAQCGTPSKCAHFGAKRPHVSKPTTKTLRFQSKCKSTLF